MFDNNDKIRLALLGAGFVPTDAFGQLYTRLEGDKEFTVNLQKKILIAVYPDKEYNSRNPYSHKNIEASYSWNIGDDPEYVVECFRQFVIDICYEQK